MAEDLELNSSKEWWGEGAYEPDSTEISELNIHFPDEDLQDLKTRLSQTRYFSSLVGIEWEYGINQAYMKELVDYWIEDYDWRKQEEILNSYKQYTTTIEGLKVHFLHYKPSLEPGQKLVPIMFIHGWPGSFYEFYKVIDKLVQGSAEAELAFEVVCPSIPGYGFSEAPHRPGFSHNAAARVFSKLMARLGLTSYYVQGGDWGSIITRAMTKDDKGHIRGVHLNMFSVSAPYGPLSYLWGYFTYPTEERKKIFPVKDRFIKFLEEFGYMHLQATKPDTVGFATANSPAGLAAYIIEKFYYWTGCAAGESSDCLDNHFTKDELLTNVMIYWLTGSMPTAMRLYKEAVNDGLMTARPIVMTRTGLAEFPKEIVSAPPKAWIPAAFPNVLQHTVFSKGGHFAAFEVPDLMADDVISFVKKVEDQIAMSSGTT